jgi:hypothetical protein
MRFTILGAVVLTAIATAGHGKLTTATRSHDSASVQINSYYPHWVSRTGDLTAEIMSALPQNTIVAMHHTASIETLRSVLDFQSKSFSIAWYIESDVQGTDDPAPAGLSVKARIEDALAKRSALLAIYPADRVSNLIELDAARDKKDGQLIGEGNAASDWLIDARHVKEFGFKYLAKSPRPVHVRELRAAFGEDFVPRIVIEDVTGSRDDENPGYGPDARALAARGEILTVVIHEGEHGQFPATSLDKARQTISAEFTGGSVEGYWGRTSDPSGFVRLKDFVGEAVRNKSAARQ